MRVGYYLFFSRGGIARYADETLRAMSNRGEFDVELVCDPGFSPRPGSRYRIHSSLRPLAHASRFRQRLRFVRGQLENPARFLRQCTEAGYSLLHFFDVNHATFPLWRSALRRMRLPTVLTVHDVRRAKALIHAGYEDAQLRRVYRQADALLVHTSAQADALKAWAGVKGDRIHRVPFGPFDYGEPLATRVAVLARYGVPRDRQVALSFGNIRDDKNLDLLIRALGPHRDRLHLIVAGRPPARGHRALGAYEQLCRDAGVVANVSFVPRYLPDGEVADLFGACQWVALPYSAAFDSYSGVLGVAARYRKPVLVSDTRSFREIIGGRDIAVFAAPDSQDALDNAVGDITARVAAGWRPDFDGFLSENSWETNALATAAVYRSLRA